MKKVLFTVVPAKGHINPTLQTALNLKETGWQVDYAAPADISSYLNEFGINFVSDFVSETDRENEGKALVDLVQDEEKLDQWVQSLLLENFIIQTEQYITYLETNKYDILVVDPLYYPPVAAAEFLNIIWVSMSNSLNLVLNSEINSSLLNTVASVSKKREFLFYKYNSAISFSGCDAVSPHLNISFSTTELCGQVEGVEQVGHCLISEIPEERKFTRKFPGRPLLYVSFGSQIYYWPEFYERLISACGKLKVELVISAGELEKEMRAPEWCQIFNYSPQNEILENASLFITHGGANSFMESIAFNVPFIICPVCNDQFHQAWFTDNQGIGRVENVLTMSEKELYCLIQNCLKNRDWCPDLERISKSYQTNGSQKACELIKKLC